VDIISDANAAHDDDFIPLVKMVKGWNKKNGEYLHSFHLEVLALQVLTGVTISDFPSGVKNVFDKARLAVAQQNFDPAGFGGDVGKYFDDQKKSRKRPAISNWPTSELLGHKLMRAKGTQKRRWMCGSRFSGTISRRMGEFTAIVPSNPTHDRSSLHREQLGNNNAQTPCKTVYLGRRKS
jgi:hypothetical protein